jgi:hypothetical protein
MREARTLKAVRRALPCALASQCYTTIPGTFGYTVVYHLDGFGYVERGSRSDVSC